MGVIEKINNTRFKWSSGDGDGDDNNDNNNNNNSIYMSFLSLLNIPNGKIINDNGKITNDNRKIINDNRKITNDNYLKEIQIEAESIKPLSECIPLDYHMCEKLILDIGLQLAELHKINKSIFFLNIDDIVVIDNEFFLLSKLTYIADVNSKESLTLTYPIQFSKKDEMFLSPELSESINAKVLPFEIPISSVYYSLAKICIYCLQLQDNLLEPINLEPIKDSKLYFFLERCLVINPQDRFFLYI
jgi:hypothetical protein